MTLREPPISNANQNLFPKDGISIKNSSGTRKGRAKNLNDQETTYSSIFFKLFLLKTSFSDSKKAVKNEKINQSIIMNYLINSSIETPSTLAILATI